MKLYREMLDKERIDCEWQDKGLRVNADLPESPAVLVLAVKPQMMARWSLPELSGMNAQRRK